MGSMVFSEGLGLGMLSQNPWSLGISWKREPAIQAHEYLENFWSCIRDAEQCLFFYSAYWEPTHHIPPAGLFPSCIHLVSFSLLIYRVLWEREK